MQVELQKRDIDLVEVDKFPYKLLVEYRELVEHKLVVEFHMERVARRDHHERIEALEKRSHNLVFFGWIEKYRQQFQCNKLRRLQ